MILPNRESAWIPLAKLDGYLLSEGHPIGRAKARLLRQLGFGEDTVDLLSRGLLNIAATQEVTHEVVSPHGVKYVVEGELETPLGNVLRLRTVWIIESGHEQPRFVTAYPL